ncbi:MAG: hypothetical protein K2P92_07230, partial [Bdellovibrionaceae bacterium]|nr:hypothetical protein [Pseudobdellovibrionaceae bacterium]
LFVMLYSIAMENQGQIDNQLRDVSSSLSKTASPPPPPPAPKPPEVTVEQQEEVIKKKDEELAQIKKAMETIEQERKEIDLQFTSYKIKNTELTEQVEILKKELKPVEPKLPVMPDLRLVQAEDKNKRLVEELEVAKKLKKETETEIEKIKFEKQQLEKKIAEAKVVTKREVAAVDDKVQKINELDKLVQQEKKQKDELQKQVQQDRTIAAELQKELQQKEKQMEQINKDLKALQDEEKKAPKFLMFVLKWFTERHDLDLIVYDSKGKKFDFKKRDYPNYPGRLALDSRSGPGAEIWQTNEFIPGDYRMIVQFYQEYNNSEDAKFVIEVSSPKTSFATSSNSIKFSEKQKEFKFRVSEKGAVTLL